MALLAAGLLLAPAVFAQDFYIRNATVHTATAQGTLRNADVHVRDGRIVAVGPDLVAADGAGVFDAGGKSLTPALFGGITEIGLEEVSGEASTVDSSVTLKDDQPARPEFDATLAYNPDSVLLPVARIEGIGFTLIGANNGGAFVAGQGGVVRLDGSADPIGPRALFVTLGDDAAELSGKSRAAQWMLLDQMVDEARGRIPATSPHALLTPAGRTTLAKYLAGNGRIVFSVNRAADIRQLLRWANRQNLRIAIAGGTEAWKLGDELARAQVPVFVDALADLPADFDRLGATLEN
ncbi:MAG TPA: amidohydrolase, partial [Pseudoxanthomonas sp.]|nr:amidohydrolase [Pseudoxanthomonas sp.]